jgi:AcrR family transcriptional regulator
VKETKKSARLGSSAAERILWAASELFYEEGIRAVGVDTIVERAEVAKMSLYKNFGSKDELVAAYLRARDERWRAWCEDAVERRAGSPKERLLVVFDAYGEWMERESPRGCAFINAFAELADPAHPAREVAWEQKRWMLRYLAKLASEAGVEEPEELAERLFMLLEGAIVASAMRTVENPLSKAKETAASLVEDL